MNATKSLHSKQESEDLAEEDHDASFPLSFSSYFQMSDDMETKTFSQYSRVERNEAQNQKSVKNPLINNFFFNPNYKKCQKYLHMKRIHQQTIYSFNFLKKFSFDCFSNLQKVNIGKSIFFNNILLFDFLKKKNKKRYSSIWMRL